MTESTRQIKSEKFNTVDKDDEFDDVDEVGTVGN